MRFTEHEMVFFNSITKGNDVFGIPLKFRTQKSHEEEVKKTINGLIEKGVLASPVLQTGTVSEKELLQLQDIDSFLREVKDCKENIMIGEFQDNALTKEWLYYWKNNRIFEYDLNRQIKREVDAVQVRRELLRLLAIDEEVKNYA